MKKKIVIGCIVAFITMFIVLILTTGNARTDVYLENFSYDEKCNQMTLKVGVSSSMGYIRKIKRTSGGTNYYYTFYSTFGINSKIGSKDTFEIQLDSLGDEIYFYTGDKGYKKVLEKNEQGKWVKAVENKNEIKIDKDDVATEFTESEIEDAKKVALDYYKKTVFIVNKIEKVKGAISNIEGDCCFEVNVSKDGVIQEPNRIIVLKLEDGIWKVINEGY